MAIVVAGFCASMATAAPNAAGASAAKSRPNILFIFTDDHAWQSMGAYGAKFGVTPRLDRLAEQGMRFDCCMCTNSLCGPSRAVIQTGKYNHLNGFIDNKSKFDGSQQTFPKLLQKAGYQTAMLGKWHLVSDPQGFDYWEVLPGQGVYYNPDFLTSKGKVKYTGYTTDIITDKAIDWLSNQRDKGKPFVLMCQHKAPHRPWEPPPRYMHLLDDVTIPEPPTLFDDYAGRASPARNQEMEVDKNMEMIADLKIAPEANDNGREAKGYRWKLKQLTPEQRKAWEEKYNARTEELRKGKFTGRELVSWKYQQYMKDYLACIKAVDDSVGRLMDYLEKSGLADNTVVMYSSDQGFFLGEHGWFDKRWIYEESMRMPLLVRWPGKVKAGSVDKHLTSNLDFAETFLDIAGVKIPSDMQGASLVPLMEGESPANWRTAHYYHYYEYPRPHRVPPHFGVRTERYTLAYYPMTDEWELFDLAKDPQEMHSVYADPAYASTVTELKVELTKLRKKYKDNTTTSESVRKHK